MSSMLGLGGAVSWCLAGPIIDFLGWRWLLWLPVLGLVPGLVLAWWIVPRSAPGKAARVDWWGAVLFAAWLVAALTALTEGMDWGWTSPGVLGLLALSAVTAGAWLWVEGRVAEPLVDLRMMRVRGVWTANAASCSPGTRSWRAACCSRCSSSFRRTPVRLRRDGHPGGPPGTPRQHRHDRRGHDGGPARPADRLPHGAVRRRADDRARLRVRGVPARRHVAALRRRPGQGIGLGFAYAAVANLVVAAVPSGETGVATGINTLIRTVGVPSGRRSARSSSWWSPARAATRPASP